MVDSESAGLTIKEIVLRLEGKIDGFIAAHEARHAVDAQADEKARSDPKGSAAGRALDTRIDTLSEDVDALAEMVRSHDRTLQRVIGALTLVSALGIGTLGLLIARLAGVIPVGP